MKNKAQAPKTASAKLDLLKRHKADYVAPVKPVLLTIKPAQYLTIEGVGKPGGSLFETRIGALYAMAYTIKMKRKVTGKGDYGVSKLECLYLNLGEEPQPSMENWSWKMLIRTPEFIDVTDLEEALALLKKRGKEGAAALVNLQMLDEGSCVQMLHVGPYDTERESVAIMDTFARSQGLRLTGKHHEIYLSDCRRVAPAKLKTLLRQPVTSA